MYGTTIHEIGHYKHWEENKKIYNHSCTNDKDRCWSEQRLVETWATFIESYFVELNYGIEDYEEKNNKTVFQIPTYTSLMIDLRDKIKNRGPLKTVANRIPESSSTFLYGNTETTNMYYTPYSTENRCPVPNTRYDGANCFIYSLEQNEVPFFDINRDNEKYAEVYIRGIDGKPLDLVSGYTVKQIETSLWKSKDFVEFENNLRNDHDNSTEQYLDELFDSWPEYEIKN